MTDTTDINALRPAERAKLGFVTDDNTGGHYVAECEECGHIFPSQTCDGGEQIADSGDYGDCYCPHCGFIDPLECDNANLVWNVQQLKIVNLTKQLEAERQRADEGAKEITYWCNLNARKNERMGELEAAEKERDEITTGILELIPDCRYMDPPDGGSVTLLEQLSRMVTELRAAPQNPVVCLKSGYMHKSEVIDAIEAAGGIVTSDHSGDGDDKVGE